MERIQDGMVRPNWQDVIVEQGLTYWPTMLPDGSTRSYWREGPYFAFSGEEADNVIADTRTIFEMIVSAGDFMIGRPDIMSKMGIPAHAHAAIKASWDQLDANGQEVTYGSVYGRIDVRYGGNRLADMTSRDTQDAADPTLGNIQLYEFNADTPTGLVESALIQWNWYTATKEANKADDQWNGIFEMLVEAWRRNLKYVEEELGHKPTVFFVCDMADSLVLDSSETADEIDSDVVRRLIAENPSIDPAKCSREDLQNLLVLEHACKEAGYDTEWRYIQEMYHDTDTGKWHDGRTMGQGKTHIDVVFKLYPWEWMLLGDDANYGEATIKDLMSFGRRDADGTYVGGTLWIEPPYKMLWSNKGLLAVLWKLFGDDPVRSKLLIPAYFEDERPVWLNSYIKKPLLGREGASAEIYVDGVCVEKTEGNYGKEGYVVQAYAPPPTFLGLDQNGDAQELHPVLGIWYVDGEPAGLGIRESESVITDDLSYFIPHVIRN